MWLTGVMLAASGCILQADDPEDGPYPCKTAGDCSPGYLCLQGTCARQGSAITTVECGNFVVEGDEECDDGANSNSCDGCLSDCTAHAGFCGDGYQCGDEECDDGANGDLCDGCGDDCTAYVGVCGDGIVCGHEVCDDGNTSSGDGCDETCASTEVCGNGVHDVGELCEDGNTISGDGCDANCTPTDCGNGIATEGEQCDHGGQSAMCEVTCAWARCGDGIVNRLAGEVCDDGNTEDGDGCSASCTHKEECPNGQVDPGETCDTNGESAECDIDCTEVVCGDGVVNRAAGEECEAGPDTGSGACTSECSRFVFVPGGTFTMGSGLDDPDALASERPAHPVDIPNFEIMVAEATVADYLACVEAGACTPTGTALHCNETIAGRLQHPINCLDWYQAQSFCEWLDARLPSEAEWEYVARGAGQDSFTYPWGNEAPTCERAVVDDGSDGCGLGSTWPVCSKPLGNSPLGLCDLIGNVGEWGQDWYHRDYVGAPDDGSAWEEGDQQDYRIVRGGAWNFRASIQRSAKRSGNSPSTAGPSFGVRCARTLPQF